MEKEKSRTLTNGEFLEVLQLEYFSHKLRSLIYESKDFAKMSKDIAEMKKRKIMELSAKFKIPTIFELPELFELFFRNEFVQEYGLPKFQYNPKTQSAVSYWDKRSLLKEGSIIIWKKKEYAIRANRPNEEVVFIVDKGTLLNIPYIDFKIKQLHTLSADSLK